MTEHLDINLVAWPHNRAARRTLAKQLGYTQAAAERAFLAQNTDSDMTGLPTADFVGDRPPPVSVVVKDAGERKDPQVQVLIDGKPAEFVTQWAASVEDLEHEYMQNVREGGEPVYVHAQNMGGLTFRKDLSAKGPDGAPVRVGTLLKPAEVATLRDEVSHTLELREALRTQTDALEKVKGEAQRAWDSVDAARTHTLRLAHYIDDLRDRRNVWRYVFSTLVGGAAIAAVLNANWYSFALVGGLLVYFGKQYWNDRQLDKLEPNTSSRVPGSPLTAVKEQPACTEDLCGCGHAPSSPFGIPGVLPETPQVVVGDNDKETK